MHNLLSKVSDAASVSGVTDKNANVSIPPIRHSSEDSFSSTLEILFLASKAENCFFYHLPKQTLHTHIQQNDLQVQLLLPYLAKSPSKLKLLNKDIDDVFKTKNCQCLLMLLVDENKQALGIVGLQYALFTAPKRKTGNHNKQVQNRISSEEKKLIALLMHKFESELSATQKAFSLYAMQSQHVQISALNQDYICIKDSAHRLVYANPALLETFPKNIQNSVLGNNEAEFYPSEVSAQIIDSDLSALISGFYVGNQKVTLANKQEKILQTTKKAFFGIDGKKYLMSVARDITEKEVLINDLKRSNSDLDNFAYVASHDLKSPINVIKRLVTWVKEDCDAILPNESKEDLVIVLSRVERMEKLLVDLLSYSRIGKDYKESSQINLREFIIELLSLIDLPMGFSMNCDDIDVMVPVIPFNVVMLNLVSNAIKHHDSGNAKIEIKAKRYEHGCTISILDNGPGIAKQNRERIFELFETLKPKDEVEGSGMGLSVVKKIVEHYGGNIKVDANIPRGTKFTVYWPLNNFARSVLDGLHSKA